MGATITKQAPRLVVFDCMKCSPSFVSCTRIASFPCTRILLVFGENKTTKNCFSFSVEFSLNSH